MTVLVLAASPPEPFPPELLPPPPELAASSPQAALPRSPVPRSTVPRSRRSARGPDGVNKAARRRDMVALTISQRHLAQAPRGLSRGAGPAELLEERRAPCDSERHVTEATHL